MTTARRMSRIEQSLAADWSHRVAQPNWSSSLISTLCLLLPSKSALLAIIARPEPSSGGKSQYRLNQGNPVKYHKRPTPLVRDFHAPFDEDKIDESLPDRIW
jgi:hypothetical protein